MSKMPSAPGSGNRLALTAGVSQGRGTKQAKPKSTSKPSTSKPSVPTKSSSSRGEDAELIESAAELLHFVGRI